MGDPVYELDVRIRFGSNALRPAFALPKYHALHGRLGMTYRIMTWLIKYLPGVTPVVLHPALLVSKDAMLSFIWLCRTTSLWTERACVPPDLGCLDIGYMKLSVLLAFVKLLLLSVLNNPLVRDFGGCLETNEQSTPTHFGGIREDWNTNRRKDAYHLLVVLVASVITAQAKAWTC